MSAEVLVVVDVQVDFLPGGALAVPEGDRVVPVIGALAGRFAHVVATQDWHPPGHLSFASAHPGRAAFDTVQAPYGAQTLWPDHCVAGTAGAAFAPGLATERFELVVRKGFRPGVDSYSGFRENDRITPTGLAGYLRERGLRRLFLAGLARDYCVHFTAEDALELGFEVTIVEDACRGIDPAAVRQRQAELQARGVRSLDTATAGSRSAR